MKMDCLAVQCLTSKLPERNIYYKGDCFCVRHIFQAQSVLMEDGTSNELQSE